MKFLYFLLFILFVINSEAQDKLQIKAAALATEVEPQVIKWRRHFHQYPELSNREFKTMAYIAEYMKTLDVTVETGMAYTGVVAVLDSGKPGKTIGLRADMDALPVRERVKLPFASIEETEYLGQKVGIMHACGHDSHVAILMGAATVLSKMKKDLTGKIVFVLDRKSTRLNSSHQ